MANITRATTNIISGSSQANQRRQARPSKKNTPPETAALCWEAALRPKHISNGKTAAGDEKPTQLHLAAQQGDKETVLALIELGADVNAPDKYGYTPLRLATTYRKNEVINVIISAQTLTDNNIKITDINKTDNNGNTKLHHAAMNDQTQIAKALIAFGADVNAKNQNGSTPLHFAVLMKHTDVVNFLINAEANVNAQTNDGWTPLHLAADWGLTEILDALVAAGAEVSTYRGDNELVLNIQKIENGDEIDSDVDLDLLTHRFMAIVKQKAMLKMKSGGHSVPPLEDMCFKTVTDYLENWDKFIEFVNEGWDELPNVHEVTTMRLFQYLKKHSQSTSAGEEGAAAAAGGVEETKSEAAELFMEITEIKDACLDETSAVEEGAAAVAGDVEETKSESADLPRETIELDDVCLDETSDSINQQRCWPSSTCTIM